MRDLGPKLVAAGAVSTLILGLAWADDEVHRHSAKIPLRGTIQSETSKEVEIQRKDNGKKETVAVNDIAKIEYDGPVNLAMQQAQIHERGGEFEKAVEAYSKIASDASTKQLPARAAKFGRASTLARWAERDSAKAAEAIKALEEFVKQNAESRFHYAAHEMLGQLQLSQGSAQAAGAAFAELGKAPWPDLQLKSTIYEGRILIATDKHDQAIAKFDAAIKAAGKSDVEKLRAHEAQLGKAECLIKQKKYDDAEKLLRGVIDDVSSEQGPLHAGAFNLLGDVQRENGKTKEAVLSYLYVDLLHADERSEHAKSLAYLALLWDQLGRADRAEDARDRLKKTYPTSPWVKVSDQKADGAEKKAE